MKLVLTLLTIYFCQTVDAKYIACAVEPQSKTAIYFYFNKTDSSILRKWGAGSVQKYIDQNTSCGNERFFGESLSTKNHILGDRITTYYEVKLPLNETIGNSPFSMSGSFSFYTKDKTAFLQCLNNERGQPENFLLSNCVDLEAIE